MEAVSLRISSPTSTWSAIEAMFAGRTAPDGSLVADNFARWFDGSQVVDAAGVPVVVMHGTWFNFSEFEDSEDIGFHFGSSEAANARLKSWQDDDGSGTDGANVMPVYLAITNPLRLPDLHTWDSDDVAAALRGAGLITDVEADELAEFNDRVLVAKILKAHGYDGIVYDNKTEGGGDSYIALDSCQVKSAIGNSGLFDAGSSDVADVHRRTVATDGEPLGRERMRA